MTPHLKYTYLLLMLVLFSCIKNELPTIIDYPLALAELHAHEFIPPAGLEPEELTYYEDENQLGVGFSADYPQKLEIPPKIVTSNTCTPKMDLKEHPEFYFSTYSHIGVIEMDTGEALLRQQLQDHVFHHVNSPSPTFDQQLYLVSYTYLPSSKQWVQNIPISIGAFHTNSQHSATRSDYAKIAAHLLTHGSIYENPQTHLISNTPSKGTYLYAFSLSFGHPSHWESSYLSYTQESCLNDNHLHKPRIEQKDVRLVYLIKK